MGKKDIIKIEGGLDLVDLDVLGFIDHNITVNIIKDGQIVEKKALSLPTQITNVIKCKNPRCITSIEQELDHVFIGEYEGDFQLNQDEVSEVRYISMEELNSEVSSNPENFTEWFKIILKEYQQHL